MTAAFGWTQPGDKEGCGASGHGKTAPDIVGTVRAIRSWGIDPDGWLRGHVFPVRWKPGWNDATCMKARAKPTPYPLQQLKAMRARKSWGWDFDADPPQMHPEYEGYPCAGVEEGCECGWFAYVDTSKFWRWQRVYSPVIEGVVEVSGNVVVGPIGLRASRARVVALLEPVELRTLAREITSLGVQVEALPDEHPSAPPPWVWGERRKQMWRDRLRSLEHDAKIHRLLNDALKERVRVSGLVLKVRTRYSDVPVFPDRDAMLSRFPVEPLGHLIEPPDEAA